MMNGQAALLRLQRRLSRFPEALGRAAGQAVLAAAARTAGGARARVPVKTGALRSSISAARTAPLEASAGAGAAYAACVEFGTAHSAAQPFLQPAADAARAQLLRDARAAVQSALKGVDAK